jgi:hypothetical protein
MCALCARHCLQGARAAGELARGAHPAHRLGGSPSSAARAGHYFALRREEWLYASITGIFRSPHALNTQLWFIWHELTANPAFGLKELRAAKTVPAATTVFETKYEICGDCEESNRIAQAQTTLRNYGG